MSESTPVKKSAKFWVAAALVAVLAVSAAIAVGQWTVLVTGLEDNEASETVVLMPMARQLSAGPGGLYGPYNRFNLLVLIHAPLYYRLGAVLAWPLVRLGLDPVSASLAVGRGVSVLSLVAILWLVSRMSRLGVASNVGAVLAVLLLTAAPVLATLPVSVRPDMLGVAFQTAGILLILSTLSSERPRSTSIMLAYVAFGLAVCVKQHLIVGPVVSTLLLLIAWLRGRLALRPIERGLLLAVAVVALVYGVDEVLTSGRTSQAVFRVAASVSRFREARWDQALATFMEVGHWSLGMTGLLVAAGLATVCARPGWFRTAFAAIGSALLLTTLVVYWYGGRSQWNVGLQIIGVWVVLPVLFVACTLFDFRRFLGGPVDRALWAYGASEVAMMIYLFKMSTGSWINYGVPVVVIGSVLTARALARAFEEVRSAAPLLPAAFASLMVLNLILISVLAEYYLRDQNRRSVEEVFARTEGKPKAFFFLNRAGLNRTHGRIDLVYDDWLYPVFESAGLAEKKAFWLRDGLRSKRIEYVVTREKESKIEGIDMTLFDLGFVPSFNVQSFYVWKRLGRRPE